MNKYTAQVMPKSEQKVVLMTLLSIEDRAAADRVVLSETPGHLVKHHPSSASLLRRIGEDAVVRDYLATFASSEEGARRVLMLTLGLAKMARYEGPAAAAALGVAAWCALSLGRWEGADSLALLSLDAAHNTLAERVREMVAGQWFAEVLNIESDFDTAAVQQCSARVLHELTETRVYIRLY
ncbi:hypothetical protein [Catenulispora pinisilvae]|uniref:hypothetical protein n=1 Tax=Catenulispora pinisilvae TaxID=2705253 RepID=UPI0018919A0B|nr:hypothetical protein [Catenulispora pinisilvae]